MDKNSSLGSATTASSCAEIFFGVFFAIAKSAATNRLLGDLGTRNRRNQYCLST